jgi:hypothetical protein
VSHWIVECQVCHGAFVEYRGVHRPEFGTDSRPDVAAGLFRHSDGRAVYVDEPAKCDTCGADPVAETEVVPVGVGDVVSLTYTRVNFLDPSYFKRVDDA